MKNLQWLVLGLIFSAPVMSQDLPGYRAGNFTGVNGVFFNPANVADSRFRWDLNLFSAGISIVNSNASFSFKELSDFDDKKIKTQLFGNQAGPASGLLSANLAGPSLMFHAGKKMSFAITTRSRVLINATDIDGKLASKIIDHVSNDQELPYGIESAQNMTAAVNGWTEFGVSAGRVISDKGKHFFKGGISLKYLAGSANGHMYINKLKAKLNEDEITKDYYINDASGIVGVGFGGADISKDIDVSDLLSFKGSGMGGDIGFVYEFRPGAEAGVASDPKRRKNNYKLRLGLALLDIGTVKYTKDKNRSGAYNINIDGAEKFDLTTLDDVALRDYNTFFKDRPQYFTALPENETGDIKVSLPTTLQIDADYFINRGFYISVAGQVAMNKIDNKPHNNQYYNSVTLTPRYEGKGFGFYVPLNYNDLTDLNAGLSVRVGPFFMGSGSVLSALLGNSKQADFHFGVHVYSMYRK